MSLNLSMKRKWGCEVHVRGVFFIRTGAARERDRITREWGWHESYCSLVLGGGVLPQCIYFGLTFLSLSMYLEA